MAHINVSKQDRKSPHPRGTGPGGWGDHTEHKCINIRMSGGGEQYSDTCSRVRGQSDGKARQVAMKRGQPGPEGNEGGMEQNLGRSFWLREQHAHRL